MIADKGVCVRNLQFLSKAKRGIISGVGHRHDNVCIDRKPAREFASHLHAHFSDVHAADHAVRTREINIFKHAERGLFLREWPLRAQSVFIDDQHFAWLNFTNEFRVNEIKGAGFGSDHVRAVEFTECERPPAKRVAHRDELALAHDQQRKCALNPAQRGQHIAAIFRGLRKQMQNDFAIGGCLEDRSSALQFIPQKIGVNQIAVVCDGHLPAHTVHHKGLRVFDRARPSGRVTCMPDRARPFELGQFFLPEHLRDKAHVFVHQKCGARPVTGHNSRALLAAML